MWYIFPQIRGLGKSETSEYYAIEGIEEAEAFVNDPYLDENLRIISEELLKKSTNDAEDIFGPVDAMKLRSSMTLFYYAEGMADGVFCDVLNKYFNAVLDERTVEILEDYLS